jgi:endonuclease/exonuclease/phosphatase family metal-dependent hydrolase
MRYNARLSILAARIAEEKYDVVCVQELFLLRVGPFVYTFNFRLFAKHMAIAGYIYHTDPTESLPSHFGQNSGVCIFSKRPLSSMEAEVYHASDEKVLSSKGFVCASVIVELPSRSPVEVSVFSVHTDARHWPSKILQLEQIKTKIASVKTSSQRAKKSVEFVIAGDFNVCPQRVGEGGYDDGRQYKSMTQQMKAAADLEDAWKEEESLPTEGEASLDHIFIEPTKWKVVNKGRAEYKGPCGKSVSDHLGLSIDLEVV